MVDTLFELMEYLTERGAPYGISAEALFEQIPEDARSPKVAYEFMQLKDISHIEPLSKGGDPSGNNWLLEDSSVNRSRGAETMTTTEQTVAEIDNVADAKKIAIMAAGGGAMATGGAIVDGVVATTEGAAIVSGIVAALPAILTVGAIAGGGWLAWKAYDKFVK